MKNTEFTRKLLMIVCVLLTGVGTAWSQMQVKGIVVTTSGETIIGANVLEKGTTNGVITDLDGNFSLTVEEGAVLVFSYIGYVTQEQKATPTMKIILHEDNEMLDEVVVVGYGVQKKSDVTGAISKVGTGDIKSRSITTVQQALQGKTSGVQILSTSAAPGASQTIRIRGYSSNYSSDPLYVVDGLRVSDISNIDPNDIESMEVLKDAASAAIYGAEAGNGVLLITTKRAKQGDSGTISYDFQFTLQDLVRVPKVMNASQYIDYMMEGKWYDEAFINNFYDGSTDTNWAKEMFETSLMQKHNLSFQKATEKSNLYVSATYLGNDGIVKGNKDKYTRLTSSINADATIKKWLKIGTNTSISYTKVQNVASLIDACLTMDPLTPASYSTNTLTATMQNALNNGKKLLQDSETGNYWAISDFSYAANPFITRDASETYNKNINLRSTFYATLSPIKGLDITSRFGFNLSSNYNYSFNQIYYANASTESTTNDVSNSSALVTYYQWENFANYVRTFGLHTLGGMIGVSYSDSNNNSLSASANAVKKNNPLFYYLDYAADDAAKTVGGTEITSRKYSYFARLNYSYANRYIAQISFRADAADLAVLPDNKRWGYFPSASLGWVVSEESWFPQSRILSFLKLRGSWGQNGSIANLNNYMWNNAIASTISYPTTNDVNYNIGSLPSTLGNRNLKWETSEQYDFGVDLRMFNDRLVVSTDYYIKKTKDLIISNVIPSLTAGNAASPVNAGNVTNKGFELEVSYKDHIGDLNYNVSANIATVKNRVTYLDPTVARIPGYMALSMQGFTSFEKGYPVWYFRGYKFKGVDEQTGDPLFEDINDNGSFDSADVTMIGSAIPDFTYGLTVNLAYKGFDFTLFGSGSQGNDVFNGLVKMDRSGGNRMQYYYDNRWTATRINAVAPRPNCNNEQQYYTSSAAIFDGSYFKIKQLQLGYTLPEKWVSKVALKNARVYVSLDDFFCFTSYPGFDPEVASSGTTSTNGVDNGNYPTSKKVVLGFNITF